MPALRLATEALEAVGSVRGWRPPLTIARAELAVQLAGMAGLPWPAGPLEIPATAGPVHSADLTVKFWQHLRDARLALAAGSVVTCLRILQTQADVPRLPRHLQLAVAVERSFVLALAGDERALAAQVSGLDGLDAPAEQALLQGLYADLRGDLRGAANLFATSAQGSAVAQPACRALALVAQAQILEELGEREQALEALRVAVTITEVSGNATPFLGWSRHGTPVHRLLAELAVRSPDGWLHELAAAAAGRPNITEVLGPWTPSVEERRTVPHRWHLPGSALANATSCTSWLAARPTRTWPQTCTSPRTPSRPTSPGSTPSSRRAAAAKRSRWRASSTSSEPDHASRPADVTLFR